MLISNLLNESFHLLLFQISKKNNESNQTTDFICNNLYINCQRSVALEDKRTRSETKLLSSGHSSSYLNQLSGQYSRSISCVQ